MAPLGNIAKAPRQNRKKLTGKRWGLISLAVFLAAYLLFWFMTAVSYNPIMEHAVRMGEKYDLLMIRTWAVSESVKPGGELSGWISEITGSVTVTY